MPSAAPRPAGAGLGRPGRVAALGTAESSRGVPHVGAARSAHHRHRPAPRARHGARPSMSGRIARSGPQDRWGRLGRRAGEGPARLHRKPCHSCEHGGPARPQGRQHSRRTRAMAIIAISRKMGTRDMRLPLPSRRRSGSRTRTATFSLETAHAHGASEDRLVAVVKRHVSVRGRFATERRGASRSSTRPPTSWPAKGTRSRPLSRPLCSCLKSKAQRITRP